jgi:tRNA-specific 2-thiouridylase
VVQGQEHPALYSPALVADTLHWTLGHAPSMPLRCSAKTRYRQPDQSCTVTEHRDGRINVEFDRPQRAVTPGQSVVLYDGVDCLGGAVIERQLHQDGVTNVCP